MPLYVAHPTTDKEKVIHSRYAKVLGSAVNPVIREGNSDRRVAAPVKAYARKNPHNMGSWSKASRSHVAHMTRGDFYSSEKSATVPRACAVNIDFLPEGGAAVRLKEGIKLQAGEVVDAATLSIRELRSFYEAELQDCTKEHLMVSLHLKATMMKISDPIMFGHCVTVYFKDVFEKHAELFKSLKVNPNNGLQAVYDALKVSSRPPVPLPLRPSVSALPLTYLSPLAIFLLLPPQDVPEVTRQEVVRDIEATYTKRPWLAMVNSRKGITNLHVPSDVIVDASMPCVVRDSGKMWNRLSSPAAHAAPLSASSLSLVASHPYPILIPVPSSPPTPTGTTTSRTSSASSPTGARGSRPLPLTLSFLP